MRHLPGDPVPSQQSPAARRQAAGGRKFAYALQLELYGYDPKKTQQLFKNAGYVTWSASPSRLHKDSFAYSAPYEDVQLKSS